jgi:hypothetical protein
MDAIYRNPQSKASIAEVIGGLLSPTGAVLMLESGKK